MRPNWEQEGEITAVRCSEWKSFSKDECDTVLEWFRHDVLRLNPENASLVNVPVNMPPLPTWRDAGTCCRQTFGKWLCMPSG